ncbi:sugar ABC transporter permease [Arachnia rubra]|uniref:Sugar ABC transporter permease n=2 Tax=Arachnia rubra TaxID=1547448 RepID=A0ABX7YA75_9ACTN|nr:sugar ABC transporter permease [Arachnia rubra]MBB1571066.1 sugar ABC transporter permease [Propionibacterium sp.]MDO4645830.1 sugar ABC transporter permease [Propionibacteriaceae bacterium]QUC09718.1 sugar ABC transporter permease [Arachnia rubra]
MLGVLIFYYFPIIGNLYASFTKTNAFGGNQKFVGLDNYTDLLARPDLPSATVNTLFYTAVVLLAVPFSVVIASLLELPGLKGRSLYRVLFFMPYLAMPVAIVLVWRLFFNGNFGLLNQTVKALGVADPPYWLSTPGLVILAVAFFGIWASIGFNVIILSAGLKSIPKELYEAAQLDGAGAWHQFKNITVPLLTPSIFFLTIMQAIGGFQLFDALFGMLGLNNPAAGASRSLVSLFYQEAFVNNNRGAGAAISIMILLLVGAVTAVQFWAQKKWVHYV